MNYFYKIFETFQIPTRSSKIVEVLARKTKFNQKYIYIEVNTKNCFMDKMKCMKNLKNTIAHKEIRPIVYKQYKHR